MDDAFDHGFPTKEELDKIELHTTLCNGMRRDLSCLKKHLREVYQESEEHYDAMIGLYSKSTINCSPLSAVTEYLSFAEVDALNEIGGIAEMGYIEGVSRLCRRFPACFQRAVYPLNTHIKSILRNYIINGLYWDIAKKTDADADRCFPSDGTPPSE